MSQSGIAQWIYPSFLFILLAWYLSIQIPYLVRYCRRKNWPSADATIQKGTMGLINRGRNSFVPACFLGYAFKVEGERYAGYFVLIGKAATLRQIREQLDGKPIQIRYSPSDPNTSLLMDHKDLRFEGLKASQDPDWLNQAPTFDLQDAIRG